MGKLMEQMMGHSAEYYKDTRPSLDEESQTGDESDYSSYIPSRARRISKPQLPSSHLTSLRGEIIQDRYIKQGRGRPRKQYLIQWKQSWVNNTCLAAPELLQSWREKKVSKGTH